MSKDDRLSHWDSVYTAKNEDEVSWFEPSPDLSLELLSEAGLRTDMSFVDIGGGASRLVDALVRLQVADIAVLDLSEAALRTAQARLTAANGVSWIAADVTTWVPDRAYDLWHDRAAFHFLTIDSDQQAYVHTLRRALRPGGRAIIGTFASDGPEKCSGLPVARYGAESLQAVLGDDFRLLFSRRHEHSTPWGSSQRFQFSTFELR
ncbi:MAG: class I SAM-dependent methyltransferase [Alphaproteobacteria bacterium]|jgi:SAM-dependent methyltransferase|nr:class I SAM-dependent methyltransferase [Alphaproteobacteria bacterium]